MGVNNNDLIVKLRALIKDYEGTKYEVAQPAARVIGLEVKMGFQFEQLMVAITSMGKGLTDATGSSNFIPGSSQQVEIPFQNASFTVQCETMSPRQEQVH